MDHIVAPQYRSSILAAIILTVALLSSSYCVAQNPDDSHWSRRFIAPGLSLEETSMTYAEGSCLAKCGPWLAVGGSFCAPSSALALWNTQTKKWEADVEGPRMLLADGSVSSTKPYVNALVSSGDSLFVFGNFNTVGTASCKGYAIYHPASKSWKVDSVPAGVVSSSVRVHDTTLICMISSTYPQVPLNIYARRGGRWEEFDASTKYEIVSLAVLRDTLYGIRTPNPNQNKYELVRWVDGAWQSVSQSFVASAAPSIRNSATRLYIYGQFSSFSLLSQSAVLSTGGLIECDEFSAISLVDTVRATQSGSIRNLWADENHVWIVGDFIAINTTICPCVAHLSRSFNTWYAAGSGIESQDPSQVTNPNIVRAVLIDGSDIYCTGRFTVAGGIYAHNCAYFSQSTNTWQQMSLTNNQGFSNIPWLSKANNQLYVLGEFSRLGDQTLNGIGRWLNGSFVPVGSGFPGGSQFPSSGGNTYNLGPNQLSAYGSSLIVGGTFEVLGSVECNNIVSLHDGALEDIQEGLKGILYQQNFVSIQPYVVSQLVLDSELVVSGDFGSAGNVGAPALAAWNGTSWRALCRSIEFDSKAALPIVHLLVDSTHHLIAYGNFVSIDSIAMKGCARLVKNKWESFAAPTEDNNSINSMCVATNGDLYAVGVFSHSSQPSYTGMSRWNGQQWERKFSFSSAELPAAMRIIAAHKNELIVGGVFREINGNGSRNVARYSLSTEQWNGFGSGISALQASDPQQNFLTNINSIVCFGDSVFFSGRFSYAGNQPSQGIALWLPSTTQSAESESLPSSNTALSVAPNPSTGNAEITLRLETEGPTQLSLLDALGRELQITHDTLPTSPGTYRISVDLHDYSNGLYFVCLRQAAKQSCAILYLSH